jgi:hypothetical protein
VASSITLVPNDFNIGKDVSGQIADDTGHSRSFIEIGHLLQLSVVQHERLVKSTPITNGGILLIETIWEDGEIHFMFERARGNLEFMVMQAAANFFSLDLRPNFTVNWFVQNKDGSQDSFQAIGGKITRPELGKFSADTKVNQSLTIAFTQATLVGPNAPPLSASPLSF